VQVVIVLVVICLAIWLISLTWVALLAAVAATVLGLICLALLNRDRVRKSRSPIDYRTLWLAAVPAFVIALFVEHAPNSAPSALAASIGRSAQSTGEPALRQHGWNHKAVANIRLAAHMVGGFSNADMRAYRNALIHIHNQHQRPGAYSIAQLVDGENSRANERVNENAVIAANAEAVKEKQETERQNAQSERDDQHFHAAIADFKAQYPGNSTYLDVVASKEDSRAAIMIIDKGEFNRLGLTLQDETKQALESQWARIYENHGLTGSPNLGFYFTDQYDRADGSSVLQTMEKNIQGAAADEDSASGDDDSN
jgi:hypothetical protein